MHRSFAAGLRGIALGAALALAPAAADRAAAEPAIWRVTDDDSTVWVFGSVHLLPPGTPWRRAEVDAALAAADIVYFEIKSDEMASLESQTRLIELGLNPPGVRLTDQLSPAGLDRLDALLADLGASRAAVDQLRPWLAMITLEVLFAQSVGATVEDGVDATLEADAVAAGKEVRAFETVEQGLDFLAGLSDADQIALLEESLILYQEHPEFGQELQTAWLTGDLPALEELLFGALGQMPPAVYERVVRNRNLDWADQLDAAMAGGDETILVVVGAGHMLGADSLIVLLEERGYTAERF